MTVLITGFGPFPGVPVNASARYVKSLEKISKRRLSGVKVVSGELPTEWAGAANAHRQLCDTHQPDILLHFGVSGSARQIVVERLARNSCEMREDACGDVADGDEVVADGPLSINATIPVDEIVRAVSAQGIACVASDDAGAYLCNAVLYRSLRMCKVAGRGDDGCVGTDHVRVGFVHLPQDLGERTCPLTWRAALVGGVTIVNACLADLRIS